jgi:ferredoxin
MKSGAFGVIEMELNGRKTLICNCRGTMPLDASTLGASLGTAAPVVHTELCRAQLARFEAALAQGGPLLVACTQEAPLFGETAAARQPDADLAFTNIRERAGWSDEAAMATPKIAALLAEAALSPAPAATVSFASAGAVLVYGSDERAIEAGRQLRDRLDVTILLTKPKEVLPPRIFDVPLFKGTIAAAKGHLGAFEIVVDDYAPALPSSRGALAFAPPRDKASSRCDLILDLSGGTPLFPAPGKRDGYFRPDARDPAAVQRALFDIAGLVGEFEKPRYVAFDAALCTHSRSRKIGCTRCLDVCPTGAIASKGDVVEIDPFVCAGCGSCASVCPTGAASYTLPAPEMLGNRLRTLLTTYYRAGGQNAVLLVHDIRHGEDVISLIARHGAGLAANVLPFAVNEVTQIGFDVIAGALAYGAARVVLLAGPGSRGERDGLAQQIELAETTLAGLGYGAGRVVLVDEADPLAVAGIVNAAPQAAAEPGTFLAMGDKRTRTMLALAHLRRHAPTPVDLLALPQGAPFGAVVLDEAGCTLCLSCVSACPTGALTDNPDKPMLKFQEAACVQCGLCRNTCPERVIALEPRLNFTEDARRALVLKEEEPAECIRCGKAFGAKSSIERIVAQLAGKHSMFAAGRTADVIRMCDDCRVIVQFEAKNPLAAAPRPRTRTTDDYLDERKPDKGET